VDKAIYEKLQELHTGDRTEGSTVTTGFQTEDTTKDTHEVPQEEQQEDTLNLGLAKRRRVQHLKLDTDNFLKKSLDNY
uniref:hypothetical protein n=1 Tax=Salmonella sp. s51944 TaxID=3159655 RepID=UPI00397ED1D0